MAIQTWKEKPEWWDSLVGILKSRLEFRDYIIVNKETLKAYLLQIDAIDLTDRGYRTTLAMTREALLRGKWLEGLEAKRLSKHSIKIMRRR